MESCRPSRVRKGKRIRTPAPPFLYEGRTDRACEGIVEFTLSAAGQKIVAVVGFVPILDLT